MKLKLLTKIVPLLIIILLISPNISSTTQKQNLQKTTILIMQYRQNKITNPNSYKDMSYYEIIQIKNQFLDLEKNYTGIEKIKHQLKLIQKIGITESNQTIQILLSFLEKINKTNSEKLIKVKKPWFLSTHMIVSHLTINGQINGILPIKKQPLYFQYINESYLNGVVGFLPIYLGISSNKVYLTAVNCKNARSYENVFNHFMELLFPCIGMSIAFIDDTKIIFEYNIDICLFGMLSGIKF